MRDDDFLPTSYDEDTDTTTTYRPGFPCIMRDTGRYTSTGILIAVMGDIADCSEDANLPCAAKARADYEDAVTRLARADEWLSDATFYPPDGIVVNWQSEAGTVTTTVAEGWAH